MSTARKLHAGTEVERSAGSRQEMTGLSIFDPEGRTHAQQKSEFEKTAHEAIGAYRNAMSSTLMITDLDYQEFREFTFNEQMWRLRNMNTYQERTQDLHRTIHSYIPSLVFSTQELEKQFEERIRSAERNAWISRESAERWISERLKSTSMRHWEKELFLKEKFPVYYRNWESLHADMTKLENKENALEIKPHALPALATVHAPNFLDMHYSFRRNAVDKALAAVAAYDTKRTGLYALADRMLENAAERGALSKTKVGTWLRRIFESGTDPQNIENFLKGSGRTTLDTLITRWKEASKRFDLLEKKIHKDGRAPSFNFIKKEKFLDMHYESRLAYLQVHPLLLDIRRELDQKDWEGAAHLIAQAKSQELNGEESQKLRSMEQFLRTQRAERGSAASTNTIDPHLEIEMLLAEIRAAAPTVEPLFRKVLQRCASGNISLLYCLKSLWYNRVWCRNHGHLDDEKEEKLRLRSKRDAEQYLKHGHGRGYENTRVEYGQPAIRRYRGEWAPQVLHFTSGGEGPLLETMEAQKDNYAFKYWSTLIPRGLDYGTHRYILQSIFPRLTSCVRRMQGAQTGTKKAG
jgi:hypothetical protein